MLTCRLKASKNKKRKTNRPGRLSPDGEHPVVVRMAQVPTFEASHWTVKQHLGQTVTGLLYKMKNTGTAAHLWLMILIFHCGACCTVVAGQWSTEVPGWLAERLPLLAGDLSIECVSDMTLQTVRCMITGWNHRRDYHHLQPTEDSTGCARKSQRNIASPTETTPSSSGVKATWRMGWLWPMNICTQRTEFIISICFNT